jgi:hypothetical protein
VLSPRNSKLHLVLFTVALILTANALAITAFSPSCVSAETTQSISIDGGAQFTNTTAVQLTLVSSTAVEMQFSNDNTDWSGWEAFATLKDWNLTLADAASETVFVQFKDASDQITSANDSIIIDIVLPTPNVYVQVSSAENNELYFDGGLSYDNIGITSYVWNFGDGTSGTGPTITHAFAEDGTFYGNLTVTDVAGNSAVSDFWVKLPVTSQATPTPTPHVPTATPIEVRTPQPTTVPTTHPTPETPAITFSPLLLTVIVAVIVIIVVGLVIILRVTRQKPTPLPAA